MSHKLVAQSGLIIKTLTEGSALTNTLVVDVDGVVQYRGDSLWIGNSGAADQVAVFDSTSTVSGSANFTWNGTTLYINGTTNLTGSLQFDSGQTVDTITTTINGSSLHTELPTALAVWNAISGLPTENSYLSAVTVNNITDVDFTITNGTDVENIDFSHASAHILAGVDEIDGDQLGITWDPTNYTPAVTPTEVTSINHLTAHLYGIDQALGAIPADNYLSAVTINAINDVDFTITNGTDVTAIDFSHASAHILGGVDEIDGDQLDIDWNPTNYTPAVTPTEVTDINHLTAHLYGIDQVLGTMSDTTYDILAVTTTGGAFLRLHGTPESTDDVKFANGTDITVVYTDDNTITINSTYAAPDDQYLSAVTVNAINDVDFTVTNGTNIETVDFSHASAHILAGLDEIDGDQLGITWNPTNYTPAVAPTEVTSVDHLTAHLYGIDQVLGTMSDTTYDILAVTTTGGAFLRLHGTPESTDDVKFANGTDITVVYTDDNTITINSTYAAPDDQYLSAVTINAINDVDFTITNGTDVTAIDFSHASAHITGGVDEIDGDQLDIDWAPTNYTPGITPTEVTSFDHLTAHLYGIDQMLGTITTDSYLSAVTINAINDVDFTITNGSNITTVDFSHASAHITAGVDEIDGDKLDIDWNPTNYTPDTAPTQVDSIDNLTAHLYGIDQALGAIPDDQYLSAVTINAINDVDFTITNGTDITTVDFSHASAHILAGVDEIDGDQLGITWNPTNYTPAVTPTEVTSVDHLTAHLYGIDIVLGSLPTVDSYLSAVTINAINDVDFTITGGTDITTVDFSHASAHITAGVDEIDGDQLDIDYTPSNYTPAVTPAEVTSLDHLTAHLYGIDQALASNVSGSGVDNQVAIWSGTSSLDGNAKFTFDGTILTNTALSKLNSFTYSALTTTSTVASFLATHGTGCHFDYIISDGTNMRMGMVLAIWDGTTVEYTDFSTKDIGDTTPVSLAVDINTGSVRFRAIIVSGTWTVTTGVNII